MAMRRVEWLGGVPIWQNGRVVWETAHGTFAPAPTDLARAHFRLRQIENKPARARRLLLDPGAWLARQRERFRRAEHLISLQEPDMSLTALRCGEGDRDAESRCIALLEAEAVCVNGLPVSPARALSIPARGRAERLTEVIPSLSPIAGVLAAMALRRLMRGERMPHLLSIPAIADLSITERLPDRPDVIAAMIVSGAGAALVARWLDLPRNGHFVFNRGAARRLLLQGSPPDDVVSIGESMERFGKVVHDALAYRHRLPKNPVTRRREYGIGQQQWRDGALAELGSLAQAYAAGGCAEAMALLEAYCAATADLVTPFGFWRTVIAGPIELGLPMNTRQRLAYLRLLNDRQASIWKRNECAGTIQSGLEHPYSNWLAKRTHHFRGIAELVAAVRDYDIALILYSAGYRDGAAIPRWQDKGRFRMLAQIGELTGGARSTSYCCAVDVVDRFGGSSASAGILNLLRHVAKSGDACGIQSANALLEHMRTWSDERARTYLTGEALSKLLRENAAIVANGDVLSACLSATNHLWPLDLPHDVLTSIFTVIQKINDRAAGYGWRDAGVIAETTALCSGVGADAMSLFTFLAFSLTDVDDETWGQVLPLLSRLPALAHAVGRRLLSEPKRCSALVRRLRMLIRLGPDAVESFSRPLSRLNDPGSGSRLVRISVDSAWYRLCRAVPGQAAHATTLMLATDFLTETQSGEISAKVPGSLRKRLAEGGRYAAEVRRLDAEIGAGRSNTEQERRAAKLRDILSGVRNGPDISRQIADRLPRLAAQAVLSAAEQRVLRTLLHRVEALTGQIDPSKAIDENLINAVFLAGQISQNRKALLALIRAAAQGDADWVRRHPKNREVLAVMQDRGVDVDCWLGDNLRTFACPGISGGRVRVYIENDPMRILPMGTYFDTCLSLDSFNAFSVVANAVELNKRVIFARDMSGRVVGRKLLGLCKDGALLGFWPYSSTPTAESHEELQGILDTYARDFASRCRLSLADTGTIPTVFVDEWYDDGACAWSGPPRKTQIPGNVAAEGKALERRIAGAADPAEKPAGQAADARTHSTQLSPAHQAPPVTVEARLAPGQRALLVAAANFSSSRHSHRECGRKHVHISRTLY